MKEEVLLSPRVFLEGRLGGWRAVAERVVAVVVFALGSDTRVAMRGSMFARCLGKKLLGGFFAPGPARLPKRYSSSAASSCPIASISYGVVWYT